MKLSIPAIPTSIIITFSMVAFVLLMPSTPNQIPDTLISINAEEYKKLEEIEPLILFEKGSQLAVDVGSSNQESSYFIRSSNAHLDKLKAIPFDAFVGKEGCPLFYTFTKDGAALIRISKGLITDYYPETLDKCFRSVLNNGHEILTSQKNEINKRKEAWRGFIRKSE